LALVRIAHVKKRHSQNGTRNRASPGFFLTIILALEQGGSLRFKLSKGASMEGISNIPQDTAVLSLMSTVDVVRAWKDAGYRRSLSAEQLQRLPGNPAGPTQLSDDELMVAGGLAREEGIILTTALGCTEFTFHSWKSCGC
jgi:mersacidin/lichenicidin family type 2 lantibiotic